jgi:hypothetical protein
MIAKNAVKRYGFRFIQFDILALFHLNITTSQHRLRKTTSGAKGQLRRALVSVESLVGERIRLAMPEGV